MLRKREATIATWKNRPEIGLFIHAVKSGQKPSLTKPGSGWKEWADEAIKRRLMEYSHFGSTAKVKNLFASLVAIDFATLNFVLVPCYKIGTNLLIAMMLKPKILINPSQPQPLCCTVQT
jgi:hypothetical protein